MRLGLDLESCYGINKLEKEIDFTRANGVEGVCSLYAANGDSVIRPAVWRSLTKDSANESLVDEDFMQVAETHGDYAVTTQFGDVSWEDYKKC